MKPRPGFSGFLSLSKSKKANQNFAACKNLVNFGHDVEFSYVEGTVHSGHNIMMNNQIIPIQNIFFLKCATEETISSEIQNLVNVKTEIHPNLVRKAILGGPKSTINPVSSRKQKKEKTL